MNMLANANRGGHGLQTPEPQPDAPPDKPGRPPSPPDNRPEEPANPSKRDLVDLMKSTRTITKQYEALVATNEKYLAEMTERVMSEVRGIVTGKHDEDTRRDELKEVLARVPANRRPIVRRLLNADRPKDPWTYVQGLLKEMKPEPNKPDPATTIWEQAQRIGAAMASHRAGSFSKN